MRLRWKPVALLAGGLLAGAALTPIAIVSAAEGDDTEAVTESQSDTDTADSTEDRPARAGRRGGLGRGQSLEALEELLGVDQEQLRAAAAEGQSLADVAAEQGVSTEEVVAVLASQAEERLAEAQEAGRIDAERAAEIESNLEERITERVTSVPEDRPVDGPRGRQRPQLEEEN